MTPAEYRAYCIGFSTAVERALAVTDLAVEQFEIRERYARRLAKLKRGA